MDFKAVAVLHQICTAITYLCTCSAASCNELNLDK